MAKTNKQTENEERGTAHKHVPSVAIHARCSNAARRDVNVAADRDNAPGEAAVRGPVARRARPRDKGPAPSAQPLAGLRAVPERPLEPVFFIIIIIIFFYLSVFSLFRLLCI
jgi:hypothetical protein